MESDREESRTGRAVRSAGRGMGRGTVGVLNWSIGHLMKVVVPVAIVLATIWGGGYYWQVLRPKWAKEQMQEQIKPMTPAEIDEADLACGLRMGWEDGSTDEERLFALIAGYNLSKEMHTGLCDVSRKFWTLRAPDNPVLSSSYRPTDLADTFKQWTPVQLAQYNKLKNAFEAYRDDPKPLQARYPWLACVTRYQRTTYAIWYPWPDKRLDQEMRLVYKTASGAKYFCPK